MDNDLVADKCLAFKVKKAARQLTRLYEEALRPVGLTSAQFTLLAAIHEGDPDSISTLADWLETDRTTLTRNLGVAKRHGWVTTDAPCGKRGHAACLTAEGESILKKGTEAWAKVQAELKADLGNQEWMSISSALVELSETLRTRN